MCQIWGACSRCKTELYVPVFACAEDAGDFVVEAIAAAVGIADCETVVFALFQGRGDVGVDPEGL